MKKLSMLIFLTLLALSVSAFEGGFAFVMASEMGFTAPDDISMAFTGSSTIAIDSPNLSEMYVLDLPKSQAFVYEEGVAPFATPAIETGRTFNIVFSGLVADSPCDYFLLKKDVRGQELTHIENGSYTITIYDPTKLWLVLDADDFGTCYLNMDIEGATINNITQLRKIPSAYDYIQTNKYQCGENEYCLRDPNGNEISITKFECMGNSLETFGECVTCPYDVMLNGKDACEDWFLSYISERYTKDANRMTGIVGSTENETLDNISLSLSSLTASLNILKQEQNDMLSSLIWGLSGVLLIVSGVFVYKKKSGHDSVFSRMDFSKFKIPEIKKEKPVNLFEDKSETKIGFVAYDKKTGNEINDAINNGEN